MIPLVRRQLGTVSNDFLPKALVGDSRSPLSTSVETARILLRFADAAGDLRRRVAPARLLPQPSVRLTSDDGAMGNLRKPDE